jgi:hypothetical protein
MTNRPERPLSGGTHSHLFLVRVWKADGTDGTEYRCTVRDVASGATRSFRDWSGAGDFMVTLLEEREDPVVEHAGRGVDERNL